MAFLQCAENGSSYETYRIVGALPAHGPVDPRGPESGDDQSTPLVNQMAGSSPHSVKYQLRTSRSGNGISGQLYMSSAWSNYDY